MYKIRGVESTSILKPPPTTTAGGRLRYRKGSLLLLRRLPLPL